jgi:beta-galactosidase
LGGRVEQYYALLHPVPVSGQFGDNTSKLWAEMLSVRSPDTKVLETYGKSDGWLNGKPAIITRKIGKGSITYVGVWMDDAGMKKLTQWMVDTSGVKPAFGSAPEGVDVNVRYNKNHEVVILVNLAKQERAVKLPGPMQDVLEGGTVSSVSLPRYGVAVLSRMTGR